MHPHDSTRKASMALLSFFLVGFLVVAGISLFFQRLIDNLDLELSNERARLFVGEQIVNTTNDAERSFLQLAQVGNEAAYKRIVERINKAADQLEQHLKVLQHGGVVRQELALNLYGIDEMVREARFVARPGDTRIAMEVIELAPFADRIRSQAKEVVVLLLERDRCVSENLRCSTEASITLQAFYKQLPSFFFRMGENANRHFYESLSELERLEVELRSKQASLRQLQMALVLLVIVSVMGLGLLFTRRINQTQAALRAERDRAEQANRVKTRFLATMSHEIRTPMNGIVGMAQLLENRSLDETHRSVYLRNLLNASQTLMTLLNDILDLSQAEAGQLTLHPVVCSTRSIADDVISMFVDGAAAKGVPLRVECPPDADRMVLADQVRLRQMLCNLVGNAVKFTEQGEIRVTLSRIGSEPDGDTFEYAVVDTGMGISQEQQADLFQNFSRIDDSSTTRFGGTGLGLAMVRNLAQLMNGDFGLQSESGRGSRFWFRVRLPAAPEQPEQEREQGREQVQTTTVTVLEVAGTPVAQRLRGHVLVAEDHPLNRTLLQVLLTQLGVTARMAEDGRKALEAYTSGEHFDCILMDLRMPEMDGLQATREIRLWESSHASVHCPIMAVTANAFDEDRRACEEVGMDDFLPKPVVKADLHRKLAQWLTPAA